MNSMKWQKDMMIKDEPHRSVGIQYANEEDCRNTSWKNEEAEPKQTMTVVDVSDSESKVQCCKEQYCIVKSSAVKNNIA